MKVFLGYLLQVMIIVIALTAILVCFANVSVMVALERATILTELGFVLLFAFFLSIDLIEGKI